MMGSYFRVEVADNGFIATYDDPEIVKQNREDDDYNDPERKVVFPDVESLKSGLDGIIASVVEAAASEAEDRARDFEGGFNATVSED